MSKRTEKQIFTPESKTLRHFRKEAKLSFRAAGRKAQMSETVINHIEAGRVTIHPHHVEKLLKTYERTKKEFQEYISGKKIIPIDKRSESLRLIRLAPDSKLDAIYTTLKAFLEL